MRFDKLTTPFQQAIQDAQSLALGNDNLYIEPLHVLAALLNQQEGGSRALLQRAGVRVPALMNDVQKALDHLPKVEGEHTEVQVSRDLTQIFNLTDKEATKRGDSFIASELFLLACVTDKGDAGRILKQHGADRAHLEAAIDAVRGSDKVNSADTEGQRESLKK